MFIENEKYVHRKMFTNLFYFFCSFRLSVHSFKDETSSRGLSFFLDMPSGVNDNDYIDNSYFLYIDK